MDRRGQLQDARAEMLMAQAELDDYVMTESSDSAMFESLFSATQEANSKYADLLRSYMEQKNRHLGQAS